jgi:hypothetical protein
MDTLPELVPFEGLEYDDDCCDVCRNANKIIRQARDEVQRLQCDSPMHGIPIEKMKMQVIINIAPKNDASIFNEDITVSIVVDKKDAMIEEPSGKKIAAISTIITALTQAAVKIWGVTFTCDAAIERTAQLSQDLFGEDTPHAERPSHLN